MTLTTLLDQSLTHAAASLSLAHQIRASIPAPEQPWRPFRFTTAPFLTT